VVIIDLLENHPREKLMACRLIFAGILDGKAVSLAIYDQRSFSLQPYQSSTKPNFLAWNVTQAMIDMNI